MATFSRDVSFDATVDLSEDEEVQSFNSGEHSGHLIDNMERFRVDSGFTDITIQVEGRQFACHKIVLASGSPYFHSMFRSGMEECRKNVIEMQQLGSDVFEQVLRFIYTGKVDICAAIVEDLFTQAHMFQITTLENLCVEYFRKNMSDGNCLSALTLADIHAHRLLYKLSKEYACQHFGTLIGDEDFYKISDSCMRDILQDRCLNCNNEEIVYQTAIRWLETDLASRRAFRHTILETIKFALLSKSFLTDVVCRSPHVMSDDRGKELLNEGIMFHMLPSRGHLLPTYQVTPRLSFPYAEAAILLGGRQAEGLSNNVEGYIAETNEFLTLKQLPFKKRNEFSVCTIGNNIYVSGGLRSAEFWKYDPIFDTWLQGSSLQHARRRHGMAAVDEQIFALGGFNEDNVLSSVEVWDNQSNKWEECSSLNQPVENMGFVSYGKKIYLFGGKNNDEVVTNSVQCYDAVQKSCTTLTRDLPVNDMCLSAVVLNSHIYLVGLEGAFRFTPDQEMWEILPDMRCPRDFVSLAVMDQKLYALGGRRRGAKDDLYTDVIEFYDPETNVWSHTASMPVPQYSYGCVKIFINKNMGMKTTEFMDKNGP